jgi:predicted TIM-barrel fold metal-dependent hydrolase
VTAPATERALARADELTATWSEILRAELPDGADIFDAHTHVGDDIDGMCARRDDLVELMDAYGVSRAFTFCMDEPDRHPAFRAANDRTLAAAAESGGRLLGFVRLDLDELPVEEAARCLDLGARGVKLHPRAQRFLPDDPRLEPVFELAAERSVPILIHGGRGLPPIADGLARLVHAHPGTRLIIAHAGIADMARLTRTFADTEGVYFDTSVWSAVDLLHFLGQVSPEQVVYASDYPYGQQPGSLLVSIRCARRAGYDDDQIRAMLAGNANRIADGLPPLASTPPPAFHRLDQPLVLARIHGYLTMATTFFWLREPETFGILGLAANTCESADGLPEADLARLRDLILAVQQLWADIPRVEDRSERHRIARVAYKLLHLADIVAVTTAA